MDGPTIFLGIVIVAVTAMVIYMFIDVTKYKELTASELKANDADIATVKLNAETQLSKEVQQREGNVNYIIDKTNEATQNLYTRFDNDVTAIQGNLSTLNKSSAELASVMRVTGGTPTTGTTSGTTTGTTATGTTSAISTTTTTGTTGREITELPGSSSPNLELISSVMATNGMVVKNTMKADKVQLGDKFLFSGVGDVTANDDWLRMFNTDGTGYRGGIAMGKLWTRSEAHLGGNTNVRGSLNVRGGKSEHNPDNWWTHMPWSGDGKNYIRGDTEIRGNATTVGDLNVGRNANVQGRLHFSDAGMTKTGSSVNGDDSYYLEKKVDGANASHLRLTLNDDADESLQIWGGSCAAGDCTADGTMKHTLDSKGNAVHTGAVTGSKDNGWGTAVNVKGPVQPESLYALKFHDGQDSTYEAGMGLIKDQPNKKFESASTLATHIKDDSDYTLYSTGWDPLFAVKGASGSAYIKGPLKVRHSIGEWADDASISAQAVDKQIGASFGGEQHWSHFPYSDQNTYVRPGRDDRSTFVGDVGLKTILGNQKTGGAEFALNAPANTVIATNPMMVNGDVEAARICAGSVCLRGQGNDIIMEDRAKTKSKVIGTF